MRSLHFGIRKIFGVISEKCPPLVHGLFLILLHRDQSGDNRDTMQIVGVPLLESIREYEEGNYEEAVDLLYPVRYHITKLGGSDAQVYIPFFHI